MSVLFLTACSDDSDTESNDTETSSEEEVQEENSEETAENTEPSAEDVLEEAAAFYDGLDGLYFVTESEIDIAADGEEENMPEAELTQSITEKQWQFMEEDAYYNRLEVEMMMEGEEDGEAIDNAMPVNYQLTDLNDPDYTISYDEGDSEAIRHESGTNAEEMDDLSTGAYPYEQLLENAELTYIGEEDINGFQTYHVEAEQDGETTGYWFDQETFFEVKQESGQNDDEASVGAAESDIEIIEYEVNPAFDESLFTAPEDIDVVDGDLEDTID
ncbi:LolA family protein [Corticicoccus populi]|uniref:Outer membrane lipoprotein carrier protein LolA n=1 Tax=Corticicoccus populi TaxID=1812821 RepID=A0ABW5WTZ6_9STAP